MHIGIGIYLDSLECDIDAHALINRWTEAALWALVTFRRWPYSEGNARGRVPWTGERGKHLGDPPAAPPNY
jgi:hypothetical protein